jgi:hypothetical protein
MYANYVHTYVVEKSPNLAILLSDHQYSQKRREALSEVRIPEIIRVPDHDRNPQLPAHRRHRDHDRRLLHHTFIDSFMYRKYLGTDIIEI